MALYRSEDVRRWLCTGQRTDVGGYVQAIGLTRVALYRSEDLGGWLCTCQRTYEDGFVQVGGTDGTDAPLCTRRGPLPALCWSAAELTC